MEDVARVKEDVTGPVTGALSRNLMGEGVEGGIGGMVGWGGRGFTKAGVDCGGVWIGCKGLPRLRVAPVDGSGSAVG